MDIFFVFFSLIAVISIIILFVKNYTNNIRESSKFYEKYYKNIFDSVAEFSYFLNNEVGYFTHFQISKWNEKYSDLYINVKKYNYQYSGLNKNDKEVVKLFCDFFENGEDKRTIYNRTFVDNELDLYSNFFNNIEGRILDKQQRLSVVSDESSNLVIAGAGSGKTTTIVGKIKYIIDKYKIKPEEILLISFTKKSSNDLKDRIDIIDLEPNTFHKLGKDIICEVENKQPSIFDESKFRIIIINFFKQLLQNDNYKKDVTEYFLYKLKPYKTQFEFNNRGDYVQYLKDKNFTSYKAIEKISKGKKTLSLEVVKSIEECMIANFLLFNNVEYTYEEQYEFDTADKRYRQYKPDFTVIQDGKKVYIEHFGISRENEIPSFFVKERESYTEVKRKYIEKINWARKVHNKNNTVLIETYSYEMKENILFENLSNNLKKSGIVLKRKTTEEIWEIINNAAKNEVSSFITLLQTFIVLMKSNNYSIDDVLNKNSLLTENSSIERNKVFINIVSPIYKYYEEYLQERNEIDFNDMINKASDYVRSGKYNKKIKYILVDEFQDISIGRYQLVKSIIDINEGCKLFCVGDDWQSIYRFNGSDISLFKDFEKYFGFSIRSKIETTYRFHNPLIKLSSDFIQKNPNQSNKELNDFNKDKSTNFSIEYTTGDNNEDILLKIFNKILNSYENIQTKKIYILGRYSFDFETIKNEKKCLKINLEEKKVYYKNMTIQGEKSLEASFLTVHKSKGLEADIVIILNCNSGKYGFPSVMSDDPVLNLLLSTSDQYEDGEERRLFYVAMTRAKEMVYFVSNSIYKSKFIIEMEDKDRVSNLKKCPNCITSDLVRREGITNGKKWAFFACSNYQYGCDYRKFIDM